MNGRQFSSAAAPLRSRAQRRCSERPRFALYFALCSGALAACTSDLKGDLLSADEGHAEPEGDGPAQPATTEPVSAPSANGDAAVPRAPFEAGADPSPPGSEPAAEPEGTPEPEPSADDDTNPSEPVDDDSPADRVEDAGASPLDAGLVPVDTLDATAPREPSDAGHLLCTVPCDAGLSDAATPHPCGCSQPSDAGAPDTCPDDPLKTQPGSCGCGFEETTLCAALDAALVHRYSFAGSGTLAKDSRGDADGTVIGTTLAAGQVTFSGGYGTGQYVDLPNGLISGSVDLTIEVWTTWNGGEQWQKLFDFGSSDLGEDMPGVGVSELFVTPRTGGDNVFRVGFKPDTGDELSVSATFALPLREVSHVAVVVDDTNDTLTLYYNGAPVLDGQFLGSLAQIDDINNWLGRSQWSGNPDYGGSIDEFRIYSRALSADELAYSASRGPDATFFAP